MLRYFCKLHNGDRYEIDVLDYNHISHRINTGRTNGFYQIRGKINSTLKFAFQYFMSLETEGTARPKDKIVRNLDIEKFAPPEVGFIEEEPKRCDHDWNKYEDWDYVQKNFDGKIQYRKQCKMCGKVSSLVKPQQVKSYMQTIGKSLEDVPEAKAKTDS